MTRVHRLWCALWPARWWRAFRMLLAGVRWHPTAVLLGRAKQLQVAAGTVIGPHVQMDVGRHGVIGLGRGVWLARDTEVQTSTSVHVGDGTTLQRRSTINGTVRLGRGCIVAPNVFISSGTHPFRIEPHLPIRQQERLPDQHGTDRPIWIQDDCWLGVNAVICPGVVVGKGSVVGANAVVTEDVPPYSVAVGVPARLAGCRLHWTPPRSIEAGRMHDMVYVLSGHSPKPNEPASVSVSVDQPVLAVMADEVRCVDVTLVAERELSLRAGSTMHGLVAGPNVLRLDVTQASRRFGGVLIELAAEGWPLDAAVRVLSIRAADAVGTTGVG